MFKRISLIVLALTMVLSISVFAEDVNTEPEIDPSQVISLGKEDTDAILKDADEPVTYGPMPRATMLFSFSGEKVYNLLTTYLAGKSFTRSDLTNGYLGFAGDGRYSNTQTTTKFRAGACYYNSNSGIYDTNTSISMYYQNDIHAAKNVPQSNFNSKYTYYGFLSNLFNDGTTYLRGTFYFYNGEI